MMKKTAERIVWLPEVEEERYTAAACYLGLIHPPDRVASIIADLRSAAVTQFQGKDIFRASGLSLLGVSNSHVEKDRVKMRTGKGLSPILLLRDERNGRVVVADGYHRLCAVYEFDEDAWMHCQIVSHAGV
jgi:hypothetical protein